MQSNIVSNVNPSCKKHIEMLDSLVAFKLRICAVQHQSHFSSSFPLHVRTSSVSSPSFLDWIDNDIPILNSSLSTATSILGVACHWIAPMHPSGTSAILNAFHLGEPKQLHVHLERLLHLLQLLLAELLKEGGSKRGWVSPCLLVCVWE